MNSLFCKSPDETSILDSYTNHLFESELGKILLQKNLTDMEILSYLKTSKRNGQKLLDSQSGLLTHLCAATGRVDLLTVIVSQKNTLNARDKKCGFTPLHFTIIHGQLKCAIRLIQLGCSLEIFSNHGVLALELPYFFKTVPSFSNHFQAFVWGCNTNSTLGFELSRPIQQPEPVEFSCITSTIAMEKYHAVYANSRNVYSCGLAVCAGLKNEKSPGVYKLKAEEKTIKICVGEMHVLLLSDSMNLYSFGSNKYYALGYSDDPLLVSNIQKIFSYCVLDICAGSQHSMLVTNSKVYTWGMNLGQLGHPREAGKFISKPKAMSKAIFPILGVAACIDTTIIISGKPVKLYMFHNFTYSKFLLELTIVDDLKMLKNSLSGKYTIAILSEGDIYLWNSEEFVFFKCITPCFGTIVNFHINIEGLVFVTKTGRAFTATPGKLNRCDRTQWMDTKRIPYIRNAKKICSDPQGRNFAVLQSPHFFPLKGFWFELEDESWNAEIVRKDFLKMFQQSDENDFIHDIIFKVGGKNFAVHSCIIFHPSIKSGIQKWLNITADKTFYEIRGIESRIFEKCLSIIYFPFIPKMDVPVTLESIIDDLINVAQFPLDRNKGDMVIKSADDKRYPVHQFVLVARSDYFRTFLSTRWQKKKLKEVEIDSYGDIVAAFIDVLYTNDSEFFRTDCSTEMLGEALRVSDEYILPRLGRLAEFRLRDTLKIRNAAKVLSVSRQFGCEKLMQCSGEYIKENLCENLEKRLLDDLTDDDLAFLSELSKDYVERPVELIEDPKIENLVRNIAKKNPCFLEKELQATKREAKFKVKSNNTTMNASGLVVEEQNLSPSKDTYKRVRFEHSLESDRSLSILREKEFPALFPTRHSIPLQRKPASQEKTLQKLPKKFSKLSQSQRQKLLQGKTEAEPTSPTSAWENKASSPESLPDINAIILEEKEEKKKVARAVNKPMELIVMEEEAIRELELLYNVAGVTDERITVQRLNERSSLPVPVWPREQGPPARW